MASDGKIYITISDKREGKGDTSKPTTSNTLHTGKGSKAEKGESWGVLGSYVAHQALNELKSQLLQQINYQIQYEGVASGNSVAMHNTQNAVSLAMKGISIGNSTYVGAKAGLKMAGPVGALVGGILGLGTSLGISIITKNREIALIQLQTRIQNKEIEFLKTKLNGISTNGAY